MYYGRTGDTDSQHRLPQVVRQAWYQEFVENMQKEMRFEVLAAANYMEIKPLLDLSCLQVTFELSGRSADEVSCYGRC